MNGVGGCSVGAHVCIPVCVKPVVNPWNHTHTTLLDPSTTATQACARLKNLCRKDYYYNYFIKKTHFVSCHHFVMSIGSSLVSLHWVQR